MLEFLPQEIGLLKQMRLLELRSNQLASVPPEIGRLNNLTWLDLRKDQRELGI